MAAESGINVYDSHSQIEHQGVYDLIVRQNSYLTYDGYDALGNLTDYAYTVNNAGHNDGYAHGLASELVAIGDGYRARSTGRRNNVSGEEIGRSTTFFYANGFTQRVVDVKVRPIPIP